MHKILLSAAFLSALSLPLTASATAIAGSDAVALINVTVSPANAPLDPISGVSNLGYTFAIASGTGTGDFSVIPVGTIISGATLYPAGADGGDGTTPFSFTITGFGTFTETANPSVLSNGAVGISTGVNLYLLGTFTPSGSLASYTANAASFDVSFTQTGESYSGSGTLQVPPLSNAPEPSSLLLLGFGILLLAGLNRQKTAGWLGAHFSRSCPSYL